MSLVLIVLTSCAGKKKLRTGELEGNFYFNKSIGMNIMLPDGWEHDQVDNEPVNRLMLETMLIYTEKKEVMDEGGIAYFTCKIMPDYAKENMTDEMKEALDELDDAMTSLEASAFGWKSSGEEIVTVGSNEFVYKYRVADWDDTSKLTHVTYSIHRNDYTLVFEGFFTDDDAQEEFMKSLENLTFK